MDKTMNGFEYAFPVSKTDNELSVDFSDLIDHGGRSSGFHRQRRRWEVGRPWQGYEKGLQPGR